MTNRAPSSADGPTEAPASPLDSKLTLALSLLWQAHGCALDAHADPWDFALEIANLYEAGLTITQLRWLVVKGLVLHGSETSVYGDAHRSFTRSAGGNFLKTTCLVLSEPGAVFASQVLQASAAGNAGAAPRAEGAPVQPALKPYWNPDVRELTLGDRLVKRFKVPARNQELILSVFQEEGWPTHIDNPLSGSDALDAQTQLHDAIARLNGKQAQPLLAFHGNGHGTGVTWAYRQPTDKHQVGSTADRP